MEIELENEGFEVCKDGDRVENEGFDELKNETMSLARNVYIGSLY